MSTIEERKKEKHGHGARSGWWEDKDWTGVAPKHSAALRRKEADNMGILQSSQKKTMTNWRFCIMR